MTYENSIREKVKQQLEYVYKNSAYYRQLHKFKALSSDIMGYFQSLPFTQKKDILQDQVLYPPYGSNLCVPMKMISRIHKTSGSTDIPLLIALTTKDITNIVTIGARCFKNSGIGKDDVVIHCLNYNMWAGGYTDHQSLEATGATVVPFGIGNTVQLIKTIEQIKPSAIHCTPSYMKKIETVLREQFNSLLPIDLGLKTGLFGAESGLQNPDFRKALEQTWGIKAYNANYGLSEVLSIFASENVSQTGLEFQASDVLYPEIVDVESGNPVLIEEGACGELVLSNMSKESQPYLRYRTGDRIRVDKVLSNNAGELRFSFEVCGRVDNMLVIKGLNVYASSIEKVLKKYRGDISEYYDILVSKDDPIDQAILRVSVLAKDGNIQRNVSILDHIRSNLANTIGLSMEVRNCDISDILADNNKIKTVKRIL